MAFISHRKMIYFRDTKIVECWEFNTLSGWRNLNDSHAFDELAHFEYDYYSFDSKPINWLGDRGKNPAPLIAW